MENVKEILKKAESLVEVVDDGELKKIAYSQLLARMLDGEEVDIGQRDRSKKTIKTTGPKSSTRKKGKPSTKTGPKGLIEVLIEEGFFEKPKSGTEILIELEERGRHLKATDLTRPLQALVHGKELRRKKMKGAGEKQSWHWSNW